MKRVAFDDSKMSRRELSDQEENIIRPYWALPMILVPFFCPSNINTTSRPRSNLTPASSRRARAPRRRMTRPGPRGASQSPGGRPTWPHQPEIKEQEEKSTLNFLVLLWSYIFFLATSLKRRRKWWAKVLNYLINWWCIPLSIITIKIDKCHANYMFKILIASVFFALKCLNLD